MTHEPRIRDEFVFTSVARAHRVPLAFRAALVLIHATALALLGHPLIALAWVLVMAPTDFLVYRAIGDVLREGHVDQRRAANHIASLIAFRYCIILMGPVCACWARAGMGVKRRSKLTPDRRPILTPLASVPGPAARRVAVS